MQGGDTPSYLFELLTVIYSALSCIIERVSVDRVSVLQISRKLQRWPIPQSMLDEA